MNRRRFLATAGSLTGVSLAGCVSVSDTGTNGSTNGSQTTGTPRTSSLEGTLRVATYNSFVDAPSSSPGPWIKKAFEENYPDVTLKWETPRNNINHYIQRRSQGVGTEADVYIGLKVPELVRIDRELSGRLFDVVDTETLPNFEHVVSEFTLDPDGRVLPVFTGYQSFVYNGYRVDEPQTLDALTEQQYRDTLIVQNPQTDNTGLYFLLWTVKVNGENGYLDYWRELLDNGVTILDSWGDTYTAYTSGEAAIITSYSTDRVYAKRAGQDLKKHKIAFPGNHGYSNLSGMGKFATSDQTELAKAFMNFMLSPRAQGKLAELNVSFPVTDNASIPEVFEKYAKKPSEPLLYTHDELMGNLESWQEEWARMVASY